MPRFSPGELAAWSEGAWTMEPAGPAHSVTHDSRNLAPGALFVALPGTRVDGHDFLGACLEAGAMGAVCARGRARPGLPCLEVEDPARALRDLAAGYRACLSGTLIGITGSAGKTTVKDLLAAMLASEASTASTRGNWNNQIGLPLSLLSMERDDVYGVFEAGMNEPGEIALLAGILRPDRGLITTIGEAHLEKLGSVEAIAGEKTDLLAALPAGGAAVIDRDSAWFGLMDAKCAAERRVPCSMEGAGEVNGRLLPNGRMEVEDTVRGGRFELVVPLPGEHMRRNLLLAVAMARDLGVPVDGIRRGLAGFTAAPMRWREERIGGRLFINDAYNANPLSMRGSIRTFAELGGSEEKWLVLGGMSELGADEESHHRAIGGLVESLAFDGVVGVGEKAAWYLGELSSVSGFAAGDPLEAARIVDARAGKAAAVLLKASRSAGMERVLDAFRNETEAKETPA